MTTVYRKPSLIDHGCVAIYTMGNALGSVEASPQINSWGEESATATGTLQRQRETADDTLGDSN